LLTRLNLALQAEVLLQRDVDYLVREREIVLIDELTGRVAENRRWPYGLQAALEAKEGVAIRPQGKILNSITLQHFLQQYECICGMTGTAQEAAEEFDQFYGLRLKVIPPHRPCIRHDLPDCIFATKAAKTEAVISEVKSLHQSRVPVLVGTASVEESEELAARLIQAGVVVQVLNARNDRHEAAVVAEAGALNAVTISTNMAGRGTDIRLGGSGEHGRERVVALGGLHVLGMSRLESRRIDNQLRGRAGRQGDPGQPASSSASRMICLPATALAICCAAALMPAGLPGWMILTSARLLNTCNGSSKERLSKFAALCANIPFAWRTNGACFRSGGNGCSVVSTRPACCAAPIPIGLASLQASSARKRSLPPSAK